MPMADNQHSAQIELWVHPAARRQGIGRELFGRAVELARGHGRTLVMGAYCEPLPGGPERDPAPAAFAQPPAGRRSPRIRSRTRSTSPSEMRVRGQR